MLGAALGDGSLSGWVRNHTDPSGSALEGSMRLVWRWGMEVSVDGGGAVWGPSGTKCPPVVGPVTAVLSGISDFMTEC